MAKTACSQCREPRFNTWSGNETSHATAKTWHNQINFFKKKKNLVIETTTLMYTSQDHLALKSSTSSRKHSHPRFPWLSGFSLPTFMPSLGHSHRISSLPLPSHSALNALQFFPETPEGAVLHTGRFECSWDLPVLTAIPSWLPRARRTQSKLS